MTSIAASQSLTITPPPQTATALTPADGSSTGSTFGAILDAINPLQHIPVVSSIYRATQGTSISPVSQIAGDALYGGLIGSVISSVASSVADVAVKGITGKSISQHVVDTVTDTGSTSSTPAATALVAAAPSDTAAPAADSTLKAKVDDAVHTILRNQVHPERVAAQYQRAQTLDIGNKLLSHSI